MAAAVAQADSAGVWLERAWDGVEEVNGKAARLWARRIEAGWRGVVGAELGGGSSSSQLVCEEEERGGGTDRVARTDKDASSTRRARIANGRRVESPAVGRGMSAEHSGEQGSTVIHFDQF